MSEYAEVFDIGGGMWWTGAKNPSLADTVTHKVVPLDAIVIDRADLPEVAPGLTGGSVVNVDGRGFDTVGCDGASLGAEYFERCARPYLAIAAHLREHPFDEAAVKQAKIALLDIGYFPESSAETVANELVAKGYRIEASKP